MLHTRSVPPPGGVYRLGVQDVARIGYGALQLRSVEHGKTVALLRRAISLGVDHVDTAQFYGDGSVNRAIREVLSSDGRVVVATKVGGDPSQGKVPVKLAQRPEQLRASLEDNLRSLGLEQIPVVNLRRADLGPGLSAEGDQIVDIDDQLAVMVAMRDEGKIGAIGLSAVDMERLERALPAGIACVQNAYSVLSRESEALLQLCLANGIAWTPFFPVGGGAVGGSRVVEQPKIHKVAARLSVTPMQVGLAWLLRHAPNTLLIPGTASVEHLEENLTVASVDLDVEAMADLDALGATRQAPHLMNIRGTG